MDISPGHVDRMVIRLRDVLAADPALSASSEQFHRINFKAIRGAASPWFDVSVSELGIVPSDGSTCTEMIVILSVGLHYKLLSVDLEDGEGSIASVIENLIRVVKANQALQEPGAGDILTRGLRTFQLMPAQPVDTPDRTTVYHQMDLEYAVKVSPETWEPVIS